MTNTITTHDITLGDPAPGGPGTHPAGEFVGDNGFRAYTTGDCLEEGESWSSITVQANFRLQCDPPLTLPHGHLRITCEVTNVVKGSSCGSDYDWIPIQGCPVPPAGHDSLVWGLVEEQWTLGLHVFEKGPEDFIWINDQYIGVGASPSDPDDTVTIQIIGIDWIDESTSDVISIWSSPPDTVDCSLFPNEGILDNFNRADEGPPPIGWSNRENDSNPSPGDYPGLVVYNNQLRTQEAASAGVYSYGLAVWNVPFTGPDVEIYYTMPTLNFYATFLFWGSDGKSMNTGPAQSDSSFYKAYFYTGAGDGGVSILYHDGVTNSDTAVSDSEWIYTIGAGSFGIQHVGNTIEAWYKPVAGAWTQLLSTTDSHGTGSGYAAVELDQNSDIIDDFGGGSISCAPPPAPTADFSGTPTSGAATLDVDFTDLSTGTPTSWLWDFGDGSTSTAQNPSHSYTFIGIYTVALTATNDQGDDTETKVDYIVVGVAPAADFSGTPTSGDAPLSVDFTDLSTGDVTDWLWDFGDGGSDVIPNATHVYAAAGTYTVALTVTGPAGTDTETKVDYITVTAAAAPVADFSGDTTSGTAPLTVNFTDLSTNTPTSWLWLFGDGASDTAQNPTHIYAYVGTYTVTLTATNAAGSDDEVKVAYITVTAVVEYGAAIVENCDVDTGGLAVGLRVADVAIARDNRLGSVVIDASAELRVKDNSYTTLTNSGTFTSLAGDRSVWDVANFPNAHASDIDDATWVYHLKSAAAQVYTISNPATDRSYDVTATTLNEIAAVLGTLIGDLQAKGILG